MRLPSIPLQNNRLLLSVFGLLVLFLACKKDAVDPAECSGINPTYSVDIKPILDASCAKSGCHDAITQENGKNFSTYAGVQPVSQTPEFLGAIQHKAGFVPMPFDGPQLDADKVELLTCWVQNGSPQ